MKNPPTLADALLGASLDRSIHPAAREHCRAVLPARKFVLDDAMSGYLADLEMTFAQGSVKKQILIMEMLRKQARLPHALTWIEMSPRPYREHTIKYYGMELKPGLQTVLKRGYLLRQHPAIETAFNCIEFDAHKNMDDLTISHIGCAWCSDDTTPVPWKQYQHSIPWRATSLGRSMDNVVKQPETYTGGKNAPDDYEWSDSELLAGMAHYKSSQAHLIHATSSPIYNGLLSAEKRNNIKYVWKWRGQLRCLWTLLATINDLPVLMEHLKPSRGFVARGSYKKFLAHTVVHLSVPQHKWRSLAAHVLVALRRRAHQVRGHWRRDWRHPLQPSCLHDFDDEMVCRRCGGHKLWVPEHQRGDASLGFVTHDYQVHHGQD